MVKSTGDFPPALKTTGAGDTDASTAVSETAVAETAATT